MGKKEHKHDKKERKHGKSAAATPAAAAATLKSPARGAVTKQHKQQQHRDRGAKRAVRIEVAAPGAEEGKTRLVGDVDYTDVAVVAGAITPVPGGVGPMTIAVLLRNALVAAYRNAGLDLAADSI